MIKIQAYHGSGTNFNQFLYQFQGQGNDQLGSGFYFTSNLNDAREYAFKRINSQTPKLGGEDSPTIIEVILSFNNLLNADEIIPISTNKIRKLLLNSPRFDEFLNDFGDVEFEGKQSLINQAVNIYSNITKHKPLVQALFPIANDLYPANVKEFNQQIINILGYDGIVKHFHNNVSHYVAFNPDQIKIIAKHSL